MTREEFTKGWALLTAQPWGRRYNGQEHVAESELQFNLYYSRLAWADPSAWLKVCVAYASADKWPPLNELLHNACLRHPGASRLLDRPKDDAYVAPEDWEATVGNLTRIIGKPFKFEHREG